MSVAIHCTYEGYEWSIELTDFFDYGSHYYVAFTQEQETHEFYFGKAKTGWFVVIPKWAVSIMIESVYALEDNIKLIDEVLDQSESITIAHAMYEYARMIDIKDSEN